MYHVSQKNNFSEQYNTLLVVKIYTTITLITCYMLGSLNFKQLRTYYFFHLKLININIIPNRVLKRVLLNGI